jgi:hypothetical protein
LDNSIHVDDTPKGVIVGDFTGDGKADIVTSNYGAGVVDFLRGNGNGTFAAPISFAAGSKPQSVVAGDFNGDGKLDLAVANYHPADTVSVLMGNGNGTFQAPITLTVATTSPAGSAPSYLAVGDFNHDGKLDLAVTDAFTSMVSVFLGNGNGTFGPQTDFYANHDPQGIAVGDFNGDGKLDLAVADETDNTVSVLMGNGNGTFATANTFAVGSGPIGITVGEFTNDSHEDIAVTNSGDNTIGVLLGNGDGTFAPETTFPSGGTQPYAISASDVNGDGKLDLAVVNYGSNNLAVFSGNGDGTFASPTTYATDAGPVSLAVGDLNNDSAPDVALTSLQTDNVNVSLNTGGTKTTLTAAPNPGATTQPLTLTATVAATVAPTGTPTGSVTFLNGTTVLGTAPLSGNTATLKVSPPVPAGTLSLTATYSGDTNFNPSTSPAVSETVTVPAIFATGTDAGGGPNVKVYNADGSVRFDFFAFNPAFSGGVRVAVGDVNGDGFPDIIVGAGPGAGPQINVYDGVTGNLLFGFFAYNPGFQGGVYVAAGDVNGDGHADIIAGADAGGGPNVTVFSGADNAQTQLMNFFPYNVAFTGGVRVAAGDVAGTGYADVITGPGPGGGPQVSVFDGKSDQLVSSFFAFDPAFAGGIYLAAGKLTATGNASIVVGAGPGAGPNVSAFQLNGTLIGSFFPYNALFAGGVRVAVLPPTTGNDGQIITVAGPGGGAEVTQYDAVTFQQIDAFFAYNPLFSAGLFVAAG